MGLTGVNSCTTWTLTAADDGNNGQVNTDVRNAEFVHFAGGDQCRYAAWKGTALEASVESVVAKGGGSGGGSAGHHINSPVVYDACNGSVTSAEALANPYDSYISFTTGMFQWAHYGDVINDSHFVTRDRMGRTMAFLARAVKDGLTPGGAAWGVGVEEGGGSLFLDRDGKATQYGKDAYVVLAESEPNDTRATAGDATALASPGSITGGMKSTSDRDYFRVTLASGRTATLNCAVPTAYDADVYWLDSSGGTLERSVTDGAGADESLTFTRTASGTGTYYVDVEAYSGSGAAPYTCTLTKG
ncbi:pre-peptidase C-terminal domain-containing protein [Streptomyces cinereoruber]|uniref:pre-peptidase C-terminal domain-containing protein n=1 Tax=Streptomyces cinereoruber TaxID=67260 RepID=UPI003EBB21A6